MLVCVPKHVVSLISTSLEKLCLSTVTNIASSAESDFAKCTPLSINVINKPQTSVRNLSFWSVTSSNWFSLVVEILFCRSRLSITGRSTQFWNWTYVYEFGKQQLLTSFGLYVYGKFTCPWQINRVPMAKCVVATAMWVHSFSFRFASII